MKAETVQWGSNCFYPADSDQRLRDGGRGWCCVLSHTLSHLIRGQCVKRTHIHASTGANYFEECTWDQKPGRALSRQGGDITKYAGGNGGFSKEVARISKYRLFFSAPETGMIWTLAGGLGWSHWCMGHQGGTCWDQGCEAAAAAAASYGCRGGSQSWGQSKGENNPAQEPRTPREQLPTSDCVSVSDHCCRRGNEGVQGSEGSLSGHRWVPVSPSAAIPAEPQLHRSGEELHYHLPPPHRYAAVFHVEKVKHIKITG